MKQKIFLLGATILLATANAFAVAAHDFHSTLTRIDWNEKEKNLEISVQMFTHDVNILLEKRAGKKVDLDKTAEADAVLQKYLDENFVLKTKAGETVKLKWVGRETEVNSLWIYLETPWTDELFGASLQNTLFFEYFPEQTNIVVARRGEKKADLLFKVGDKFKELSESIPKVIKGSSQP